MAVTEIDGVVINHVTLAKYHELKEAGQLVNTETYVITDLDEHIDDLMNNKYWQIRAGRMIICDCEIVFCNQSPVDLSGLPLDTVLMGEKGQNGNTFTHKLVNEDGMFKLKLFNADLTYSETYASGSSLSQMTFTPQYDRKTSVGYGLYCEITYLHESLMAVIDNCCRIGNNAF